MKENYVFCVTYKLNYFDRPCLRMISRQIEETLLSFDIQPKSIQIIRDENKYGSNLPWIYMILVVAAMEHPDSVIDLYEGALDIEIDGEESGHSPNSVTQVVTLEEAHRWLSDTRANSYYYHFEEFDND